MGRAFEIAALAARRPDLALRRLRGLSPIEIDPHEAAPFLPEAPVILEAGACDGRDTLRLVEQWPRSTIHAFEPVPAAFLEVTQRTQHLKNVHRYELALAATAGTAPLHVSTTRDGTYRPDSSSLRAPAETLSLMPDVTFGEIIEVQTQTLDGWALETGVPHIDFMWLDMQGVELDVLMNGTRMLETASAVCLEVSKRELYAGCATYDQVVPWMRGAGFQPRIERITRFFGNMLFVRK